LRHAKSSWDHLHLSDFDRPLNARGENDAPTIGKEIQRRGIIPEMIFCSSSKRTKQTLDLVHPFFSNAKILYLDMLYHSSEDFIFQQIKNANNQFDTLMIVAHNPGITFAFEWLGKNRTENVPTCGAACFSFDVDSFTDVKKHAGKLEYFIYPKVI
jgi:phosphohistidine phosphatase